jgi:hypothetical protein
MCATVHLKHTILLNTHNMAQNREAQGFCIPAAVIRAGVTHEYALGCCWACIYSCVDCLAESLHMHHSQRNRGGRHLGLCWSMLYTGVHCRGQNLGEGSECTQRRVWPHPGNRWSVTTTRLARAPLPSTKHSRPALASKRLELVYSGAYNE